jgi:predicted transcriptional regulator
MRQSVENQQRLKQEQEQFKEKQKEAAEVLKQKEELLKLQQDRLEFEKERESRLVGAEASKATAREQRAATAQQNAETRRIAEKTRLFKALTPEQQTSIMSANQKFMKQAAGFPLGSGEDEDIELAQYEGQTASQIARSVSTLERSLSSIDEIDRELAPDKFDTINRQLQASKRALEIRMSQHSELVQSQGHTISSDAGVLNNLSNGLASQIANDLGMTFPEGGADPTTTGKQDIDKATSKSPTPTQTTPEPTADVGPTASVVLPNAVASSFISIGDGKDVEGTPVGIRQEFGKLSPQDKMTVFRQVESALGTDRARSLIFGR